MHCGAEAHSTTEVALGLNKAWGSLMLAEFAIIKM